MRAIVPVIGSLFVVFAAASAAAEVPIQVTGKQIAVGEVLTDEAADVMGLAGPSHTPLVVIEAPPVGLEGARLVGTIESIDVESEAWVELWAIYPDGTRSVERTLDRDGPDLRLAGTTERRRFALSVALGRDGVKPQRLELNVGMLGRGIVSVSKLRLEGDGATSAAFGAGFWALGARGGPSAAGAIRALPIAFGALGLGAGLAWHARSRRRVPIAGRLGIERLHEPA